MDISGFPLALASHSGSRVRRSACLALTLLLVPALWLACIEAAQAQLSLSQVPPASISQEPAPNVILSLDDSGSMAWYASNEDRAPVGQRRIDLLVRSLRNQFGDGSANSGRIADGQIRLAWQAMNNSATSLKGGGVNSLKRFEGGHRAAFDNFVRGLIPAGGTPTHSLMKRVHDYMSTASGVNSPFADNPGVRLGTPLQCRRTFHILLTDGGWNSADTENLRAGNADGTLRAFPDGTSYDPQSDQSRAYSDPFADIDKVSLGTVSDFAFMHWATDYAPNLANGVRPLYRKSDDETIAQNGRSVTLQPYWNPRNNPMTWQGVTTFTIGFGSAATQFTAGAPAWDNATDDTFGGTGYRRLVTGLQGWPNPMTGRDSESDSRKRTFEMWHAALNGRGKFYPARDETALKNAFSDILNNIFADTTVKIGGLVASSSRLKTDTRVYSSLYDSSDWSGDLRGHSISPNTGSIAAAPLWSAGGLLNALSQADIDQRKVFTHNGSGGRAFKWDSLSVGQKIALQDGGDKTLGENRLKYLRGSRALETDAGGLRVRGSRLGSIVNSQPWFTPKRPSSGLGLLTGYKTFASAVAADRSDMLYVGANGGMLHGFDASSGKETVAYVPMGVYPHLAGYTKPAYTHRYLVDGSPFTADANFGNNTLPDWKTVLVGSLGNGGKGYFLLDVTRPNAFAASSVLADLTDGSDADIGHMALPPSRQDGDSSLSSQVVRTNDGKWSVLLGNGVNSANSKPFLLVHRLDSSVSTNAALTKVGPTDADTAYTGGGNGLSTPRTIDLDGDGTADLAYAGDMLGNLWRFDLSSAKPDEWKAARVYRALDAAGSPQSISAPPLVSGHPKGGLQVVFGTGRNLTTGDATSNAQQTLYGVWDSVPVKTKSAEQTTFFSGRNRLQKQQQLSGSKTLNSIEYFQTSDEEVKYELKNVLGSGASDTSELGWYLDLPDAGYRTLAAPRVFEGGLVLFNTALPARADIVAAGTESCEASSVQSTKGKLFVLSALAGRRPSLNVFVDLTGDVYSAVENSPLDLILGKGKEDIPIPPPPVCTDPNKCSPNNAPNIKMIKNWTVPPIFSYTER